MIKVLDLFAGTQSVRKALTTMNNIAEINKKFGFSNVDTFDYIGIDIYSPELPNTILDLTQDDIVEKLIKVLPEGWKPDFIWASPICNAFSMVNPGKGGNYNFILDKETETIRVRDKDFGVGVCRNYKNTDIWTEEKHRENINNLAIPSLKMFENTKKIIDHYNVPFAIENPATALSRYILKDYERTVVNYCMYGQDRKKPTAIYTNKKWNARPKCNHKKHSITHNFIHLSEERKKYSSDYAFRSSVPPLLIKDIITQLTEENNGN